MSAVGWAQPSTGKTSHLYEAAVEGSRSVCGMAYYREYWDGHLTLDRPLGVKQCLRCIRGINARSRRELMREAKR